MQFPVKGRNEREVTAALEKFESDDAPLERLWASTHYLDEAVVDAAVQFMAKNCFFHSAFPSCARLEGEVVAMVGDLLGHPDAAGSVTPGGTMSNILAVLAAREHARKNRPEVIQPNIVAAETAHPSVEKGGILTGVEIVRTSLDESFKADPRAIDAAIDENTIAIFCTAGTPTHGQIDPIADLGQIAEKHELFLHVDACLGGFLIPFARKLGYPLADAGWDFRVRAVSSMSIDPHKLGLAAYPTSVQLYRTEELFHCQSFNVTNWTGEDYASPGIEGSHSGAGIASAWTVFNLLGEEGYLKVVDRVMKNTQALLAGVREVRGLGIAVEPETNVIPISSPSNAIDLQAVAAGLTRLGWKGVAWMRKPNCLRLLVMPHHEEIIAEFLRDLETVTRQVERSTS